MDENQSAAPAAPEAPAVFRGIMEGFGDIAPTAIYNMTARVEGRHILANGSTVTRATIERAGFQVPTAELQRASNALLNYMAQRRQIVKKNAA